MIDVNRRDALLTGLAAFGSDFSRWPEERGSGAREAILQDGDLRQAWERARELDYALAERKEEFAREIAASGAVGRVRRAALARLPVPLSQLGWHRIAAAMLLAGALGGAMDLYLASAPGGGADLVLLDPLYGLNDTEMQ